MGRMKLWGYPLLAALAAAPVPPVLQDQPHAVYAPQARRPQTGDDRIPDRQRPRTATSERERDAALLLMLGDAAAHWHLR